MIAYFPKYNYYITKDSIRSNRIRAYIMRVLEEYNISCPEVFIEDELGTTLLSDRVPISCTRKRDIPYIKEHSLYSEYTDTFCMFYNSVRNITYDESEYLMPDIKLLHTDIEKYNTTQLKLLKDRMIGDVQSYQVRSKLAVIFEGNSTSKLVFTPQPAENDGILYLIADIEQESEYGMYSGNWLNKNSALGVMNVIRGF